MRLRRMRAADADRREFLAGANEAFGAWGDEATFAWAFRGGDEVLFIDDVDGHALGGSGIFYRTLIDGRPVAIQGASWTLPAARGRGVFTRFVEAIRDAAAERGGAWLGFVRRENESSRRVAALGAAMHPTFYCRSTAIVRNVLFAPLERLEPDPALFPSSFRYTPEEWRVQFLERPHARVECLGRRGGWVALVERSDEFDRVHAVSDPAALPELAARAQAAGRRLFWFTARPPSMPCEWTEGFLGQIPLALSDWELQNGDRI